MYCIHEKFCWIKISQSLVLCTFVLQKNLVEKYFANAVKVTIISSIHRTKNYCDKLLPMRAGGKIGENFFLAKISMLKYHETAYRVNLAKWLSIDIG